MEESVHRAGARGGGIAVALGTYFVVLAMSLVLIVQRKQQSPLQGNYCVKSVQGCSIVKQLMLFSCLQVTACLDSVGNWWLA